MAIVINGSGTVTGISVGGLPDVIVDSGTLATDAVTIAKLAATGTASSSTFLRGDNAWEAATLAALTDSTVSASDPATDTNPSAVGHYWVNKTSGECYVATDVTTDANVWTNIGGGSGNIELTQVATFDLFEDSSAKLLYQMEDNVLDTGGSYNGTNTSTTFSGGKFGQAAVFNGSSSQVAIPTAAFAPNVDTVSFWFKLSNTSDTDKIIFYSYSSGMRYYISQEGSDLMFRNPDNTSQTSWGASLSAGTWYHAVLVKDADAHRKGYINGSLELDAAFSNMTGTPTNVNLGSASWTGSIDQVRIFNRALSSAEVTTLYTETNTQEIIK